MSKSNTNDILGIIVRLLGLAVLAIGLTVALKVMKEAWDLYKQPENVERFATAIEHGSGLDNLINKFTNQVDNSDVLSNEISPRHSLSAQQNNLRLTYFVAWVIVVLLLLVIGGLAMSAIRTGGQLALYDLQVKRFAREVLIEAKRQND